MLMNWPREFEAQLVEDPRYERGISRLGEETAFFYEGKELAHFKPEGINIRLTASGIYALQARLTEDCVISVGKEWVLIRLESEADTKFALALLERAVREAHNAQPGPKGKQTRRAPAKTGKSEATRAFHIAKALKDLEELEKPSVTKDAKAGPRKFPKKP